MNMLKRAYRLYVLHKYAISHVLWIEVVENLFMLRCLTAVEKAHLREICTLFLHEKNFIDVQGLKLSEGMRLVMAVQACLPVLKLGYKRLETWSDLIVYPGPFRVARDSVDTTGVVHHQERLLSGESWARGPVIVSWADVEGEIQGLQPGRNVVIHEIAHKLDMLNGVCNGCPPLHRDMSMVRWSEVMSAAYQSLIADLEQGRATPINPYAAESPGEFFAVISEYFFCSPLILQRHFPAVFQQLRQYYRQNPLDREEVEPLALAKTGEKGSKG